MKSSFNGGPLFLCVCVCVCVYVCVCVVYDRQTLCYPSTHVLCNSARLRNTVCVLVSLSLSELSLHTHTLQRLFCCLRQCCVRRHSLCYSTRSVLSFSTDCPIIAPTEERCFLSSTFGWVPLISPSPSVSLCVHHCMNMFVMVVIVCVCVHACLD